MAGAMLTWLVPLLRCPSCQRSLSYRPLGADAAQGILEHDGGACVERYPVIDAIPRLLIGPARAALVRTKRDWFAATEETTAFADRWSATPGATNTVVSAFDDEWRRYRQIDTADQRDLFELYF